MVAICSSETSADFQRTTGRYIPEDRSLHNHRCESLNSCIPNIQFRRTLIFKHCPAFECHIRRNMNSFSDVWFSKSLWHPSIRYINIVQCLWYWRAPILTARLHRTPLDLLHSCIHDSTSRHYNLSFWLQLVLTLWCLVSERSFDLFFFRMLAANWLTGYYY
jgi:hypothetical protein